MRVVLLGAGASFGCGPVRPESPPLAPGLYDALRASFPGSWGSLPPHIDALFQRAFEVGMQELWEKHSNVVPELTQQMAVYFVQFRPSEAGTTLYARLVDAACAPTRSEQNLLSTLNYECVLELEASAGGHTVEYFGPPAPGVASVWKLHGSCNFLPDGIRATRAVRFTSGVSFGTSVRAAQDLNEVLEFCLGDNSLPPVMSLFMKGKPTQVSPQSVSALQAQWSTIVRTATNVIVVGVSPNESDSHIWGPLAETQAHVSYCGDEKAFESWRAVHRHAASQFLAPTFAEAIPEIETALRS